MGLGWLNLSICMPTAYAVGITRTEYTRFAYLGRMPTTFAVGIHQHRTASTYAYGFCCRHCLHAAVGVLGLVCAQ